jgi:hypothetical protein
MKHINSPFIVVNEMKKRLDEESKFTEDDLKNIAAAASVLGTIESRVTYASVKQSLNSQSNIEKEESANE